MDPATMDAHMVWLHADLTGSSKRLTPVIEGMLQGRGPGAFLLRPHKESGFILCVNYADPSDGSVRLTQHLLTADDGQEATVNKSGMGVYGLADAISALRQLDRYPFFPVQLLECIPYGPAMEAALAAGGGGEDDEDNAACEQCHEVGKDGASDESGVFYCNDCWESFDNPDGAVDAEMAAIQQAPAQQEYDQAPPRPSAQQEQLDQQLNELNLRENDLNQSLDYAPRSDVDDDLPDGVTRVLITPPLGVKFDGEQGGFYVTTVKPGGGAEATGKVARGMKFVAVNGTKVNTMRDKGQLTAKIKGHRGVCTIDFCLDPAGLPRCNPG